MVDVVGVDQSVHRGVDRRRRAAAAVQRVVEQADHLVLAVRAGVDVDQRAHPVQPKHGQALFGQRAEIAAGSLDPHQVNGLTGGRIGVGAFRRGVPPGVIGVLRVGAQPVGACDQCGDCGVCHGGPSIVESRVLSGGVRRPRRTGCHRRVRRQSGPGSRIGRRRASDWQAVRAAARHSASRGRTSV